MGKFSDIKIANIKKNKSKLQKKLEQRKKVKYGKKITPVELRTPVTFYDRRKLKEAERAQKKQAVVKNEKPKESKPPKGRNFAKTDDLWDPLYVDKMIEEEDNEYYQQAYKDEEEEQNDEKKYSDKAKLILDNIDDVDMDDENDVIVGSEAEKKYHVKVLMEREKKEASIAAKKAQEAAKIVAPRTLLPIVNPAGEVVEQQKPDLEIIEDEVEEDEVESEEEAESEPPKVVSTVDILLERKIKLYEKKLFIGDSASKIIADPDGNMGKLKEVIKLVFETDAEIALSVRKIAALSLLTIFNNILPSYKLATMDRQGVKLKKATRDLAVKEKQLLSRYTYYLKGLEAMVATAENNNYSPLYAQMANVALTCMSDLLIRHPTFNKSDNLLRFLVPHLSNNIDELRLIVVKVFERIFKEDENGQFSLRVLKDIREYIKGKGYQVHSDAMRVLIHLRITQATSLDSMVSRKVETERAAKETNKLLKKMASKHTVKVSISDKKRRHKVAKLEHKLKEKRLNEKKSKDSTIQTEIIELLFALYIHVVKNNPNRKVLGAVLEGLALFGHLINVEYFSDLLANLENILLRQNLTTIESIHCIQTVFRLLTGLGSAMPNDPACFSERLFGVLMQIADIEVTESTVKKALETLLLFFIQCKKRVVLKQSIGFVKRLSTLALSADHSFSIPMLTIIRIILLNHRSCETLLDTSGEGASGVYQPFLNHPIHCNAEMSALYEMHTLAKSYHPMTKQLAVHIYKGAPLLGEGCLPASFTKLNTERLMSDFTMTKMEFRPAMMHPQQHIKAKTEWSGTEKKKINAIRKFSPALQALCETESREITILTKLKTGEDDEDSGMEDEGVEGLSSNLDDYNFYPAPEEELITLDESFEEMDSSEQEDYSDLLLLNCD